MHISRSACSSTCMRGNADEDTTSTEIEIMILKNLFQFPMAKHVVNGWRIFFYDLGRLK